MSQHHKYCDMTRFYHIKISTGIMIWYGTPIIDKESKTFLHGESVAAYVTVMSKSIGKWNLKMTCLKNSWAAVWFHQFYINFSSQMRLCLRIFWTIRTEALTDLTRDRLSGKLTLVPTSVTVSNKTVLCFSSKEMFVIKISSRL